MAGSKSPDFDDLSPKEINRLPLRRYSGPTHVIRSRRQAGEAIEQVRGEALLGFDTETRPAFKKGTRFQPALVQLATRGEVFLFQISRTGLVKGLREVMSDPGILKVGVGLDYDVRELKKMSRFKPASFLDLARAAKGAGLKKVSLRALAATFLGFRISKGAKTSNWAAPNLKPGQVKYAATDAWVSREIYLFMAGNDLLSGNGADPVRKA